MKTKALLAKLSKKFPKKLAASYDHVGLQTGTLPEDVRKVLLCLDFDKEVLPIAEKYKPDLIITHHPFIFGTKAKVFKYDLKKKELSEYMDKIHMPIVSYHTNFDTGKGGMNDALANALGLINIYAPLKDPMMRIGELKEEMEIEEFAKYAKKQFNVEYGLLINKGTMKIKKVAIIGGGGSRGFALAKDEDADIYISGDAPHHVRRQIVLEDYNYLDFPHEIEKIFMPTMKKYLLEMDSSLDVMIVDHEKLPKVI